MFIDPFTEVYRTLRTGFLSYAPLSRLVNPKGELVAGNFIDASQLSFDHFKTEIQAGDTPDIVMVMGAFRLMPFGVNSLVTSFTQSYQIIATQDTLKVLPVGQFKYYVMIALLKLGDDLGLPYVRDVNVTNGADDPFGQSEWKRGTQRYMSVMSIQVDMQQSKKFLLAFNPQ